MAESMMFIRLRRTIPPITADPASLEYDPSPPLSSLGKAMLSS